MTIVISKSRLRAGRPDGGLVIANERYSGIDVVLGCFPEGGDSTVHVSVFLRRSYERSCKTTE